MKIANILHSFKNLISGGKSTGFSDFLKHASPEEKKKIFKKAAEKANQEQRETLRKAEMELKTR